MVGIFGCDCVGCVVDVDLGVVVGMWECDIDVVVGLFVGFVGGVEFDCVFYGLGYCRG